MAHPDIFVSPPPPFEIVAPHSTLPSGEIRTQSSGIGGGEERERERERTPNLVHPHTSNLRFRGGHET
jgi:hypothetical protein